MISKKKNLSEKVSFNEQVYEIVAQIPKGKVMTYAQIAKLLHTKAYRAVGNALNKNPHPITLVPCHRVIKTNRELGGYNNQSKRKYELLKEEGVEFEEFSDTILEKEYFHIKVKQKSLI